MNYEQRVYYDFFYYFYSQFIIINREFIMNYEQFVMNPESLEFTGSIEAMYVLYFHACI